MAEITLILQAIGAGDAGARDQLMRLVYDELHALAAAKMAREPAGHTLQPTALVNEAWIRMGGDAQPPWQNRRHFFGAAAEAMRRILVDRARRRQCARRGGGQEHANLDDIEVAAEERGAQVLALDEALARLAVVDPAKAELVRLRYFAGLSFEEVAAILEVSLGTAKRWWTFARAWLQAEMKT